MSDPRKFIGDRWIDGDDPRKFIGDRWSDGDGALDSNVASERIKGRIRQQL